MNIVKEHINFQRGLEPKHAMGIGINPVAYALQKFIKADKDDQYLIDDYGIFLENTMFWISYNSKSSTVYFKKLWKNAGLHKYFTFHKNVIVFSNREIEWLIKPEYKHLFTLEAVQNSDILDEGLNFERGIDPKDAMTIGIPAFRELKKMHDYISKITKVKPLKGNSFEFKYKGEIHKLAIVHKMGYVIFSIKHKSGSTSMYAVGSFEKFRQTLKEDHLLESNFMRGLNPKDAMIGQKAMDQKLYAAIKTLPINDEWILYFPKAKTKRIYSYIKIVLPLYWIMRKTAVYEIVKSIKSMNAPNIKTISINNSGDILIKLKK